MKIKIFKRVLTILRTDPAIAWCIICRVATCVVAGVPIPKAYQLMEL